MTIVQICGGLGNQMFQYAFAKALESKGESVVLDISWYSVAQDSALKKGEKISIKSLLRGGAILIQNKQYHQTHKIFMISRLPRIQKISVI